MASSRCILFFFFSCVSLSSAENHGRPFMPSSKLKSPTTEAQAEKLIGSRNLFSKHEVNHHATQNDNFGASGIVEEKLKVPLQGDPGTSVEDLGQHAGFYPLPRSARARMFYFFFQSRAEQPVPVIMWLSGGPGCGSEMSLFYENGPFHITDNLTLTLNQFGWDTISNVIFVDQPTGAGFSYTDDVSDIRTNSEDIANDLFDFLQAFFKDHPDKAKVDFYIAGEGYAGHYIPALAVRLLAGNNNEEGVNVNLRGIIVGNGFMSPAPQYKLARDYALDRNLIDRTSYQSLSELSADCVEATEYCGAVNRSACEYAFTVCDTLFSRTVQLSGVTNMYDVSKEECDGDLCYDLSNMENFLDQKPVRDALGVGDLPVVACSEQVRDALDGDWMRSRDFAISYILASGVRLLLYAGENDFAYNWMGIFGWISGVEWPGEKEFKGSSYTPMEVDGKEVGSLRSREPLTFAKIKDAGHYVPMDQPKVILELLTRWIQGKPI